MKKNLFYLFALICSMSLFTACSDDDNDANWKKVPSQAISAENLSLTTNTQNITGASVKLVMSDEQNGVLTLTKAIRGLDEVEVNVTVAEQTDGTFKFQGEKSIGTTAKALADLINSTTVKVAGNISLDSKAEVTVTTEAIGGLVKKWQLCDALYFGEDKSRFAPCRINWVSAYGEDGVAADNIQTVGTTALSVIMMKLLKDVEFKANGSIVANYAEDVEIDQNEIISAAMGGGMPSIENISWLTSPANLAYWYVADNHIYVMLDIPAILNEAMGDEVNGGMTPEAILGIIEALKGMKGAEIKQMLGGLLANMGSDNLLSKLDISKIADADVEKLIGYLVNGFPLGYQVSEVAMENGSKVKDIYVYLEKGVFDIFMPALYPILPDVETILKGMTVEFFGQQLPVWSLINLLTQIESMTEFEGIWGETTEFKFGLDLTDGSLKTK